MGDIMVTDTLSGTELFQLLTNIAIEINAVEQAVILIPIVLLAWMAVWITWKYADSKRK